MATTEPTENPLSLVSSEELIREVCRRNEATIIAVVDRKLASYVVRSGRPIFLRSLLSYTCDALMMEIRQHEQRDREAKPDGEDKPAEGP